MKNALIKQRNKVFTVTVGKKPTSAIYHLENPQKVVETLDELRYISLNYFKKETERKGVYFYTPR